MNLSRMILNVVLAGFALLILSAASCQTSVDPSEPVVDQKQSGPPPSGAGLFQNVAAQPAPLPQPTEEPESPVRSSPPGLANQYLMMVFALVMLFLLSVLIFHPFGRQLRRKRLKAHAPTSHLDIWATHKPPQFLDP